MLNISGLNSELIPNKLIMLGFSLPEDSADVIRFERALLYTFLGKMALHTKLVMKDMAIPPYRETLLTEDASTVEDRLTQYCESEQARYILTGAIEFNSTAPGGTPIQSIDIQLRLYDAHFQRFAFEHAYSIANFETSQPSSDNLQVPFSAFVDALNWMISSVVHEVLPSDASTIINKIMSHSFASSYDAIHALIYADRLQGTVDERIEAYEKVIAADPNQEVAYFNLGKLYKTAKKYRQSVFSYRKALDESNSDNKVRALYATEAGICCALLDEDEEAVNWWLKAIQMDANYINPYINIALHFEERNNIEQAEIYFIKAQEVAPEDTRLCYSLARVYSKMSDWGKALGQYQKQVALDTHDPWCHSNIATCYLQLSNPEMARQHFERTAALDPKGEAGQYARMILSGL